MLFLKDLMVTHNELRNYKSVIEMSNFVRNGRFFDISYLLNFAKANNLSKISPLIQITQFEDGKLFIMDGHHRVVSCLAGQRNFLDSSEFKISLWTYREYIEISHDQGWYTPFDPRTHVRTSDFASFKKKAKEKFTNGESVDDITRWIFANQSQFLTERRIWTANELYDIMKNTNDSHQENL